MVKVCVVPEVGSFKILAQSEYDFEACPEVGDTITMDGIGGDLIDVVVVGRSFWAHNLKQNRRTTKITLTVKHE